MSAEQGVGLGESLTEAIDSREPVRRDENGGAETQGVILPFERRRLGLAEVLYEARQRTLIVIWIVAAYQSTRDGQNEKPNSHRELQKGVVTATTPSWSKTHTTLYSAFRRTR